jgi:iron complex transport system substrate-binding protein
MQGLRRFLFPKLRRLQRLSPGVMVPHRSYAYAYAEDASARHGAKASAAVLVGRKAYKSAAAIVRRGATASAAALIRGVVFCAVVSAASIAQAQADRSEAYPLKLRNCGAEVTLNARPERIVAIKSTAAEMVLALGAGARLVGTGFLDAPLPETAPTIAILSDKMPASEVVLGAAPDLIYAGWESAFSGEAVGERRFLAGLGIATYVSPAACRSEVPAKLSFDAVFAEIAEMGQVLDASAQAATLIAAQRQILESVQPDTRGLTALWYSSGTKVPYVGAGSGAPQMMLEGLGLENIFADVADGWTSASWEAVLDADPDVIVLVDSAWNSAAQKRRLLAENPLTALLPAVQQQRYLEIAFPAAEAGVRSVPALRDLARQLAALDLKK